MCVWVFVFLDSFYKFVPRFNQESHFMRQCGILKGVQMSLITMLALHRPSVENTSSFPMETLLIPGGNLWAW